MVGHNPDSNKTMHSLDAKKPADTMSNHSVSRSLINMKRNTTISTHAALAKNIIQNK